LSADNTIRIWDLRTGRHLRELPIPHPFHESTIALSTDGHQAAAALFKGGPVTLHGLSGSARIQPIDVTGQRVREVAYAPQGQLLAIAGDYRKPGAGGNAPFVALWDLQASRERRRLDGVLTSRLAGAFSLDGRLFVDRAEDRIRLWDLVTGGE